MYLCEWLCVFLNECDKCHSKLNKSARCCTEEREREREEKRDKEREGDRKKGSSLWPLFFIKLILAHKSLARRPRRALIPQASKTQSWEAVNTKVWFPFVSLRSVLCLQHFIGACFGWALTKTEEKEGKGMRKKSESEKFVCMSVSLCLLTAGSGTSHLFDTHPEHLLFTQNTNPLTHGILYHTNVPCLLASKTRSFSSSFLMSFF